MDKILTNITPFLFFVAFIIVILVALKSKSNGGSILNAFKEKRMLMIEITAAFMALTEGLVAANLSSNAEGLAYGVRLCMHICLTVASASYGFSIYDQIREAAKVIKEGTDTIVKEVADAVMSMFLTIAPAAGNTYFIAILLKGNREVSLFFSGQFNRLTNETIFMSCLIFCIHVGTVIYLGMVSSTHSNGGADDPLTQASDDDDSEDADDDKPEIITTLPVPTAFDPTKVDVQNYLHENFPNVDKTSLNRKLRFDNNFKTTISNLVIEALTHREDWDNQKAIISEAQRIIDMKTRTKEMMERSYNHDPEKTTYKNVVRELKDREEQTKEARRDCKLAEDNYNAVLDEIQQELGTL